MTATDPERPDRPSDAPAGEPKPRPPWLRARWWILAGALLAGALSMEGSLDTDAQAATDRVFRQS